MEVTGRCGKNEKEANDILLDAKAVEEAGAYAVVIEKIPALLAKKITEQIKIPTIGIGAGVHCDGQVLVTPDMLGLNVDFHPRFVRYYSNQAELISEAVKKYIGDVKSLISLLKKKATNGYFICPFMKS